MSLYNTSLEPSLQLTVNSVNTEIAAVGAFNTLYLLAYTGEQSNLPSYKAELISSLENYRDRIGGTVPTAYIELINYLSVDAAYKNTKGLGAIKVIAVRAPSLIYTITIAAGATLNGNTASYKFVINGVTIDSTVAVPTVIPAPYTSALNYVATKIAEAIKAKTELSTSVYIREVSNATIEISTVVTGQSLSIVNLPGTASGVAITAATTYGPAGYTVPESKDYIQALYLGINQEDPLGVIIAPGFYATASSEEALLLTKQVDSFCRQAHFQQLFIADVSNPDLTKIPLFASVPAFSPTPDILVGGLFKFGGQIYKGLPGGGGYGGILPGSVSIVGITTVLAGSAVGPLTPGSRIVLPQNITIGGINTNVLQAVNTASIADVDTPTLLELANFIGISHQQLINEYLFVQGIGVVENGSANEQALYTFRDDFNSVEGHVSVVAPYQNYTGPLLSLSTDFPLPASVYQAALWIYTANAIGPAQPPASDDYALEATKGPIWQVTSAGHALLNGKGINIIKTINSNAYIMGARTLSQNDLYNRQNARLILSLYVRTLRLALKAGLVLKPLNSTGAFLALLQAKADRVSRAFYTAGLLDGTSENAAWNNKCDASINSLANLQQGIIRLESKIAQIGMTEKIIVTVQESLIGDLQSIL
jgi:hypothetical protein